MGKKVEKKVEPVVKPKKFVVTAKGKKVSKEAPSPPVKVAPVKKNEVKKTKEIQKVSKVVDKKPT